jgi:hypothetical protein
MANSLFLKILNGFQSCIILVKHGLPFEALALSRTLCDPLYILRIFYCDHEFWRKYFKYGLGDFRKKFNVARNDPHSVIKSAHDTKIEDFVKSIEPKLANFSANEFKVEELAKNAGMSPHYDTMFRSTSDEIHCGPNVFFRYATINDADKNMVYNSGPTDREFSRIFVSISDVLLRAVEIMDDIFKVAHDSNFEQLRGQWQVLNSQTNRA